MFLLVAIILATFALYARVGGYDFINFDDDGYVWDNPHVKAGLTPQGIRWAFTTDAMGNWHPLTWLSLMLDVNFFGVKPGAIHLVNVVFHAASAALLFVLLSKLTGARWCSAWVAAMFALHPLHVESVAWISERKDVLSTLFMMLTLLAYVWFVRNRNIPMYVVTCALFALGLMAKPMIVTLPCVMLLIDYWPLGRMTSASRFWPLVIEKLPLFALAGLGAASTVVAQARTSIAPLSGMPLGMRLANAIVAYGQYLRMTVTPYGLALFYPHPATLPGGSISSAAIVGSGAVIAVITLLAILLVRRMPWILMGWLWYLGTLVPVIGLVQVGKQALADRYAYVPLIGIFIAIAWTAAELFRRRLRLSALLCSAGVVSILAAFALSWHQLSFWRNSETVWRHCIDVVPDSYLAYSNLGEIYDRRGDHQAATELYRQALRIQPNDPIALYNLAAQAWNDHDDAQAQSLWRRAIAADPNNPDAYDRLALLLAGKGELDEAIDLWRKAAGLAPDDAQVRLRLDQALRYRKQLRATTRPL